MDEGAEAYVFTSDAVPGVVYKIFPRTPAGGYGLVDQLSTDETDRITNEVRDASSLEPLINKLLVIDELGVPSEILGMGDDGSVVVKQSDARDRDVAGGNKFFHASGDVRLLVGIPVTHGEGQRGMADDERLLVKAGDFEDRVPAVGTGGFFRSAGLHAILALQQKLNART